MNIVHIAPNAPYNEGWGYQENLLTKYQARQGNAVSLIITNEKHGEGKIEQVPEDDYMSKDGFRVIRKKKKKCLPGKYGSLFTEIEVYDLLVELKPDYVFYHGLISMTIFQVKKYKRKVNQQLVIVQDNHLDYNIGFNPSVSLKSKIKCQMYKWIYKKNDKYINKVYGVTPWRKQYVEDVFGVPASKTDVLIMGADDEKIDFANRETIRKKIREEYGIKETDFLIVTGGKIDFKKKIDVLMEACGKLSGIDIKLLVFGTISEDISEKVNKLSQENNNIIMIGWIPADKVYDYYFAADLVFFPGQHSVLWEQACASKVPCVFEKWECMDHVNNGGNSDFISPVNVQSVMDKIRELKFTDKYYKMKKVAESNQTDIYLYSKIAEKSLECVK